MTNQLTATEQAYKESLLQEAIESLFDPKTVNARLLQAKHTITALNDKIVIALLNGESENSDYIQVMSDRIIALISQVDQLEALVGLERRDAA